MKSLIVVGGSKSLIDAGDSKKSLIVEDERTLLITFGDRKSLETCEDYQNFDNFCGDVRILHDFLEKNEDNSDNLYWGIRTWEAPTGEKRTRKFRYAGKQLCGENVHYSGSAGDRIFSGFSGSTGDLEA